MCYGRLNWNVLHRNYYIELRARSIGVLPPSKISMSSIISVTRYTRIEKHAGQNEMT